MLIVPAELGALSSVGARHRLLHLAEQRTDGSVLARESIAKFRPVALEEFHRLEEVQHLVAGGGLDDDARGGDVVHRRSHDASRLLHLVHQRRKLVDGEVARLHKLEDSQRHPVERVVPGLEHSAKLAKLLAEEQTLHLAQSVHSGPVPLEHLIQRLSTRVELILLQRHLERRLGNGETHAIEVPRLAEQRDELRVEVDDNVVLCRWLLCLTARLGVLATLRTSGAKDRFLEPDQGDGVRALDPCPVQSLLILHRRLGEIGVLPEAHCRGRLLLHRLRGVRLQAVHRLADATEEPARPRDGSCDGRLVRKHGRVLVLRVEHLLRLDDLARELLEDVVELICHGLPDGALGLDALEALQQIESVLGGSQLLKRGVDEHLGGSFDGLLLACEVGRDERPIREEALVEDVEFDVLHRRRHRRHSRDDRVDRLGFARHRLQLRSEELVEAVHYREHPLQIRADARHVIRPVEKLFAVKLPPRVAP